MLRPQVILTKNYFILSNISKRCFICVTHDGSFIIVFIDDQDTYDNPPEGTYAHTILKHPETMYSIFEAPESSTQISKQLMIQLKHLSVIGPVDVYINCCHETLISMVFKDNARSFVNLSSARTNLQISQKSSLKIKGTITELIVPKLDVDSSLDICDCRPDRDTGFVFSIPIADPIGNIFIHPNMSHLREVIIFAILQRGFRESEETERQRHVRCNISVPLSSENMIEVKEDHERACNICFTYIANAKFDCDHVYMCLICAEKMRALDRSDFTCPICRYLITTVTLVTEPEQQVEHSKRVKRQRIK
jgi:hypothetical protein